jgi:hypothetical protein
MKLKPILGNAAVFIVSLGAGLLLAEFAARMVLNPADYLSVNMAQDKILGATVPKLGSEGFDKWGFRNLEVPSSAEIVAVGDSHTFGNTARMNESWPKVLESLTGQPVYNMGMGGYGPNQYDYLLKTKGLSLKPKLVICGLYMGDDFENAFSISYGLDYWAYLRQLRVQNVNSNIWEAAPQSGFLKGFRVWLSQHSVVYQLLFHASFLGRLQGEAQIKNAPRTDPAVTSLDIPGKNILEAFRPRSMLIRLDQQDPRIREGMRITFQLLKDMNEQCRRNSARFMVLIIPTKEMVFAEYLEHNPPAQLSDVLDRLFANERIARAQTIAFLQDSKISYVDALPALTKSASNRLYARTAADMHPNKAGYRVLAEATYESLKAGQGAQTPPPPSGDPSAPPQPVSTRR